ncbi:amino acid ABC transporter permease [Vampirovibrio sp.]|uniref:amino acid ABC transporter permease n=1 Tax=Vampirovibrio sp. TaxID=2717857 RepID=UPI0035930048
MDPFLTDWSVQQAFLEGLLTTLKLSAMAAAMALTLGFGMAFARVSEQSWLKWPAGAYVELFRNTPLLIQLYLYYRGLQSAGLSLSPETCGVLALSLYTGAYLTEVFRSGLLAIPQTQSEAGLSLGLSRFKVYRLILVPQAMRLILPAIGNQLISLVKNSSLVAFITVNDLFLVIYKGAVDQFKPVEYFLEGAALYLSVSLSLSLGIKLIEKLMSPPTPKPQPALPTDLAAPHG